MSYKKDWFKGATNNYTSEQGEDTTVTFKFPNAATPVEFTTWLYKHDEHGNVAERNMAAEMLQCFVDAVYDGYIVAKMEDEG